MHIVRRRCRHECLWAVWNREPRATFPHVLTSDTYQCSIKRITVLASLQGPEPHLVLFAAVPGWLAGLCKEPPENYGQFPAQLPCILLTHAFCVLQIRVTHSRSCGGRRPLLFIPHAHFWTTHALLPMDGWLVSVRGYLRLANNEEKSDDSTHKSLSGKERKGWRLSSRGETLTLRPTPADSLSVSLKRAANTFSLLSVSVSVSSNTPHPTPHAVYDTWGPQARAHAESCGEERESVEMGSAGTRRPFCGEGCGACWSA
jgi:hypothetical protein